MLAIRLQRVGRKKLAQFRVVVQESHLSPTSGRVVAALGSYDPHTKKAQLDTETAEKFLSNGAQPSDRVARLLKKEGVKLPSWVKIADNKERTTKNPDKLRKNQPEEPKEEAPAEEPAPAEAEEAKPEEAKEEPEAEEVEVKEEPKEENSEQSDEKPAEPKEEAPESEPEKPEEAEAKKESDK